MLDGDVLDGGDDKLIADAFRTAVTKVVAEDGARTVQSDADLIVAVLKHMLVRGTVEPLKMEHNRYFVGTRAPALAEVTKDQYHALNRLRAS